MTGILNRLFDGQELDKARDERLTRDTINALQGTNTLLVRVIVALIVVLGVLVAGVVGVGVTGTLPGVGEISVSHPTPAAEEEP